MQIETERTLRNLTVIGALHQNDKLITCNEVFAVHEPTSFRALYRWSYGENREGNLTRLQTVVRGAEPMAWRFSNLSSRKRNPADPSCA